MKVAFSVSAEKQFLKLDASIQKQIKKFLVKLVSLDNPRSRGKSLAGSFAELWRYRVGDYRLVCDIQDENVLITVIRIGHRKEVYL
ncbi:type II toxin-antitoxin system RelE/ParE family toxin [Spirochaetota bacterium]